MRQAADSLAAGRTASPDRSGTVVAGRFRLEVLLGREGGTEVYQAIDGTTGSPHAVRLVPFAAITGAPERLLAEIEKTQALRHKNLVEVEAAGIDGDIVYIAAELVDGQTLREFIDAKRSEGRGVSLKGACNLVAHVSNALDYASRLTRHGALNPAIIWVNRAGRVKVSGLGIAPFVPGFARHGSPKGAPDTQYMAPEVVAGAAARATADVYSLGTIFYELVTGQPPGNPLQPASRLVANVPESVDAVIARALSRTPEERWTNPTAFKDALQQTGVSQPTTGEAHAVGGDRRTSGGEAPSSPGGAPVGAAPPRSSAAAAPPVLARGAALGLGGGSPPGAGPYPAGAMPGHSEPRGPHPVPQPARSGSQANAAATGGAAALPLAPPGPGAFPAAPSQRSGVPSSPGLAAAPAAALPANPDDLIERWLIHKDSLDFGPFSMVQIRAQIERGEILPDHLMIDNDSGNKLRVRDVPGLGALAKTAHRRLEQTRRAQAEQRSEKSEKKKSVFTGVVITVVLLVLAGGTAIFLLSRHDTSGGHLASREEEAEIDNFLKGVKIGVTKATVNRAVHHAGGGNQSGGSAEDFNNDANFGDVGKGFYQGDQTLDDDQIQNTMMANYRKLIPCIVHSPGVNNLALEFAVRGNGKVSAVKVNGQRTGALPACMLSRMQSFNFPKFNGSKTIASWSMSMGR